MTFFGMRTIRDGEKAAVWSKNGTVKVVDGPKRLVLVRKKVEPLRKEYANESEYLEIRKQEGRTVIVPGPAAAWPHPIEDICISKRPAIFIDGSQALVVYTNPEASAEGSKLNGSDQHVERRIVLGPARFIPCANQWVHNFSWSGIPKNGSKTTYQPGAYNFQPLSTIPGQMYHNVNEVRTNDDTLLTVKLMIFYELKNIEKMLEHSADPIADFINAASADVVAFCAAVNYEDFLTLTAKLNELDTFSQLCVRADAIGYCVTKVVFRGFQAGDKLQAMHDNAIQERVRLRLKEETEQQEQRGHDMRLDAERARATRQAELEIEQARTRAELSRQAKEAMLAEAQMAHEAEMRAEAARAEATLAAEERRLELARNKNAVIVNNLREMQAIGIDLTQVLVSQHQHPDKVLRIETAGKASEVKTPGGSGAGSEGLGLLSGLQLQLS